MVNFNCFTAFFGKKKNSKKEITNSDDRKTGHGTLQVKLEQLVSSSKENGSNSTSFNVSVPYGIQGSSTCKVKLVMEENTNSIGLESAEAAYEGSNEHDENSPIRRDLSDFDLPAHAVNKGDETEPSINKTSGSYDLVDTEMNGGSERDEEGVEVSRSGHISDPGIGKTAFWGSPKLKRSCSHLGTQELLKKFTDRLPPSKSQSFGDLQNSMESGRDEIVRWTHSSPLSIMTSCSADKVMLKRLSSRQLLPSRSRRLWWKLFLWSHRNLHKPGPTKPMPLTIVDASSQKDGYWSDTLESSRALAAKNNLAEMGKSDLSRSLYGELKNSHRGGNGGGGGGLWAQNQWVAFPIESSSHLSRVDEWVNSLDAQSALPLEDDEGSEGETRKSIDYPLSPEKAPLTTRHSTDKLADELLQANNVIQSMNSFSTVAHIASIGLKVVPNISPFTSLRSVNLSGNFIVHITAGSLPKSLQTLNLSRNKITAIDGLRELTRLRVLDLSYNRISRIGRGLSNCTLIKELYLAGNKISDVEGLHRLLKLTVLDLSFNKITTAKALSQLVANYKSLLALNLLGNPIQTNIGDDQLRKAVLSLLPQLAYLNKQPIKPQRAREVAMDSVAKAALGNGGWNSRRKLPRRGSQGSLLTKGRGGDGVGRRGRHRPKSVNHQQSPITRRLST